MEELNRWSAEKVMEGLAQTIVKRDNEIEELRALLRECQEVMEEASTFSDTYGYILDELYPSTINIFSKAAALLPKIDKALEE